MKIALGTVQFGLDYGISNTTGKITPEMAAEILSFAAGNGIDTLDTAQAYGSAEEEWGKHDLSGFKIVTKLFDDGVLETSLQRLNVSHVYAAMFHRENQVNDKTWAYFESLKAQKLTSKIGVSVYSPDVLADLAERYPLDIVQLPMNILDLRFLPLLKRLKEKGVEIHTRSAFLQGLIFMDPEQLDPYFDDLKPALNAIPSPKLNSALHCLKQIVEIDKIVVGVTNRQNLAEICEAYRTPEATGVCLQQLAIQDERFINPVNWLKKG